jgi:hypothetical protein
MDEQNFVNADHCTFCDDVNTRKCIKCQRFYCITHRSKLSPQLCQDCFASVQVIIDKYVKITEEYDEDTDTMVEHKSSCKRIRLDGPDWVWMSVAINQMNDEELGAYQEIHRYILSLIETIKTQREINKLDKLRAEGNGGLSLTQEQTTKTRTRKVVKQVKTPKEILAASGITELTPGYAAMLTAMEAAMKK